MTGSPITKDGGGEVLTTLAFPLWGGREKRCWLRQLHFTKEGEGRMFSLTRVARKERWLRQLPSYKGGQARNIDFISSFLTKGSEKGILATLILPPLTKGIVFHSPLIRGQKVSGTSVFSLQMVAKRGGIDFVSLPHTKGGEDRVLTTQASPYKDKIDDGKVLFILNSIHN